jgi:hypothetical protein
MIASLAAHYAASLGDGVLREAARESYAKRPSLEERAAALLGALRPPLSRAHA